jgi:hypothetical protein
VANLSPGGLRNFNLIDILATLNGDAQAGNSPDLTIDESYTLLATVTDTATTVDLTGGGTVAVNAISNGTWGGDVRGWGLNLWNS